MRRIQEKLPVEKTIWEPVSVPVARFIAFEQMVSSLRRWRGSGAARAPRFLFTSRRESQEPNAEPV